MASLRKLYSVTLTYFLKVKKFQSRPSMLVNALAGVTSMSTDSNWKLRPPHTGERPYECDECEYSCTRSCSLARYNPTRYSKSSFNCDDCEFRVYAALSCLNCITIYSYIHFCTHSCLCLFSFAFLVCFLSVSQSVACLICNLFPGCYCIDVKWTLLFCVNIIISK